MIQDRLNQRIEQLATLTGSSPEEQMVELTRLAEVAIGEGNSVYGKANLKGFIETRVRQRTALLIGIETIHQRQQEQLLRLAEDRITLSSILVLLRKQLAIPLDLAPAPTPTDLGKRNGYIRRRWHRRGARP